MLLEPDPEHVFVRDPRLDRIEQTLRHPGAAHDDGRSHGFGNDADELLPLDVMPDRDQLGDDLCRGDHGRLDDQHVAAVDTAEDEDQFAAAGQRRSTGPGPKAAADQRRYRMGRRVNNGIRGKQRLIAKPAATGSGSISTRSAQ